MDTSDPIQNDEQEPITASLASISLWWKRPYVIGTAIASAGIIGIVITTFAGYYVGRSQGQRMTSTAAESEAAWWTCSMHPQVKLPKPGKCPICFMPLIPLVEDGKVSGHPRELVMSREAIALAEIQTVPVQRKFMSHNIRLVGKVDYDQTKLAYITAWMPGRLDRLFIDNIGVPVREGDHLVEIYSPGLVEDQRGLLQMWRAFKENPNDEFAKQNLKSAEERLRLKGLLLKQIEDIKKLGKPTDHMTIYAEKAGVVIHKNANEGMYVDTGTKIYTIADLSQVWIHMDAYESDVAWLTYGQQVEFTTETYPGEIFQGRVAQIYPTLDEKTRTVKVRVNVPNPEGRLKPGMFVRALVRSRVAEGGQVIDDSLAGKWVSPHHPEIIRDEPGKCPICGIGLVPAEELGFVTPNSGAVAPLVIPASAPLLTGKRAVVYVAVPKQKQPTFQGREVLLGPRVVPMPGEDSEGYYGDYYIVRHGLEEGEQVVFQGNFKIDSALQIAAKPSMMSPAGGASGGEHQHHGHGVPTPSGSRDEHASHNMAEIDVPAAFRVDLNPVYLSYLSVSEALAADDLAKAREELKKLLAALKRVNSALLDSDARSRWKVMSDNAVFAAHDTLDAEDRATARADFNHLSVAMTPMIQTFGHALDQPVYQFHCTMAFNNKGAAWLQSTDQARNPYFGPAMLQCGDPMATFHPLIPLYVPSSFRKQLSSIYDRYLELQTQLAADEQGKSVEAAIKLREELAMIDSTELDKRTSDSWTIARTQFDYALKGNLQKLTMIQLRERFESLSLIMLGVVENFGHAAESPLYRAFCPMAFKNKGAPWLQRDKKIANPYFGAEMFGCGNIERVYEPQKKTESLGEK